MKVVEFLKRFNELKYDDNTELLVLLTKDNCLPKFIQIEDLCNNEDCLGYNEIGIVLHEENNQIRCESCRFSRPLNRTKSPEKYFREDCIVCECEDVVGDEPMIYSGKHYCSFGRDK